MIIDCFPYGGELDLLNLRLELLWEHVDLFVISEVGQTHSGINKPLLETRDGGLLTRFGKKMEVVSEMKFPDGLTTFERDWWQRELPRERLDKIIGPDDFLLYGDLDEFPRPESLLRAHQDLQDSNGDVAIFAQDLFFVWMNYRETSGRLLSPLGEFPGISREQRKWLGSALWRWTPTLTKSLTALRDRSRVDFTNATRISNGGWHFTYVSDDEVGDGYSRFSRKLNYTAHQEFNLEKVRDKFWSRVAKGRDPLGRRWVKFTIESDNQLLPGPVQKNLALYNHQIF